MSEEINVILQATDEASGVIAGASEQIDSSLAAVSDQAEQTDAVVSGSMNGAASAVEKSSGSLKQNVLAMNSVALAGASLVAGISGIENAEVALDRAYVTVEKGTNAVTSAQEKYTAAVAKYGPSSREAQDAAAKLQAAQDALTVAHERVDVAQRNLNDRMMMTAMTVVPSVIGVIGSLSTITESWTAIQGAAAVASDALGSALDFLAANPIMAVILVIGLIVAALVAAYNACPPFRDAVNAIAGVLSGALGAALSAIRGALEWLWNNVLVPLGNFLAGEFNVAIQVVSAVFAALSWAVSEVYTGLKWLWDNVLVPLGEYVGGALLGAWNALSNGIKWAYDTLIKPVFDALLWVYNSVLKPIGDFFGGIGKTLGNIGSSIGGFFGGIGKMLGLAEGGIVTQPTVAVVGEAGPEAVIPLNENFSNVLSEVSGNITFSAPAVAPMGNELGLPEFAGGGIVSAPTLAFVGEAGPEAVVPLIERNDVLAGAAEAESVSNVVNNMDNRVAEGDQNVTINMTTNPSISIGQR